MSRYIWPVSMLEEYNVPADILIFFQGFVEGSNDKSNELEALYAEHQLLKDTSSKQDRYIAELEKQLGILQKTLDLVDKNKPRFIVKQSSADIVDIFNREPVILHTEADSITPIYPDRWVPVTDRLPNEDTRVLVWLADDADSYTRIDTDCLLNSRWVRWSKRITHWMPLPQPPNEGK